MTFPRFAALVDYWKENPPVHILVKAFVLGVGGRRKDGKYEAPPGARPAPPRAPDEVPAFTAAQFNELSGLMGGVSIVQKAGT